MRWCLAQSLTAGTSMATRGVLFMNAESDAVGRTNRAIAPATDLGRPKSRSAIHVTPPVSMIPALTTNSTPMVIIPSLAKPPRASLSSSTPATNSAVKPPNRTKSGGNRALANSASTAMTTAMTTRASTPIGTGQPNLNQDYQHSVLSAMTWLYPSLYAGTTPTSCECLSNPP